MGTDVQAMSVHRVSALLLQSVMQASTSCRLIAPVTITPPSWVCSMIILQLPMPNQADSSLSYANFKQLKYDILLWA
jgi:hypothetical protein